MAQRNLSAAAVCRGSARNFFRQVRAYFVAGGGRGLVAYVEYERAQPRKQHIGIRRAALTHPIVIELAEQWSREGVQLDYTRPFRPSLGHDASDGAADAPP